MLWFLGLIVWIMLLFPVVLDLFRSDDLGGLVIALWLALIILVPFVGVLVYVIARGKSMVERGRNRAREKQQAVASLVRQGASAAQEVAILADLRDRGLITHTEFEAEKVKIRLR